MTKDNLVVGLQLQYKLIHEIYLYICIVHVKCIELTLFKIKSVLEQLKVLNCIVIIYVNETSSNKVKNINEL